MAQVQVHVVNNSGQKSTLLFDDERERDIDLIDNLKARARREELESVKVTKVRASKDAPPAD